MKTIRAMVPIAVLGIVLAAGPGARGGIIVNGGFQDPGTDADPFAGWTTTLGVAPTYTAGAAVFNESQVSPYTQLEQVLGAGPATKLSFDYLLQSQDGGPDGNPVPDSFQATLWTDNSYQSSFPTPNDPFLPAFFSVDTTGPEFYDPAFVTVSSLGGGWRRVTLNLGSLANIAGYDLEFVLTGREDGHKTTVSLTNVSISADLSAVPEPSTWVPAVLGVAGLLSYRGRRAARATRGQAG